MPSVFDTVNRFRLSVLGLQEHLAGATATWTAEGTASAAVSGLLSWSPYDMFRQVRL